MFEVTPAADAIKSAGNVLDNALTKLILDKSTLVPGSAEYRAALAFLNRETRAYRYCRWSLIACNRKRG